MTDSGRRDMPGRLLRLLSLLQSRRTWSGTELATRLGVTERTVRRDVDRLRDLDYQVRSTTGTAGGYKPHAGAVLPPLLLDDGTVRLSADSAELVVQFVAAIAALGAPVSVDAPPEITDRVRALARALSI